MTNKIKILFLLFLLIGLSNAIYAIDYDYIFGNSEESRYIAEALLNHEEAIDMSDFDTIDKDTFDSYFNEAYKQNPLVGNIYRVRYDAANEKYLVDYVIDKDTEEYYQEETLKKIKEIAQELNLYNRTELEKELLINQYIINTVTYNKSLQKAWEDEDTSDSRDFLKDNYTAFIPYGGLVEKSGVCEAYAESFKLLADEAGLECIIVTGVSDDIPHEWCKVKINGKWYNIDPTVNDNSYLPNTCFNLSDKNMMNTVINMEETIQRDYMSQYKASDNDIELYRLLGRYASSNPEAVKILLNILERNPDKERVILEFPTVVTQDILREVISQVNLTYDMNRYTYRYRENFLVLTKK